MITNLVIGSTVFTISFIGFILVHRYIIKEYTSTIAELDSENEELLQFISEIQSRSAENYLKIQQVDKRGSFSSDDEVGFVFTFLKETVADIHTFLTARLGNDQEKRQ